MFPAVQEGNVRPPACALTAEGADAGNRGDRDTAQGVRDVELEQAWLRQTTYGRFSTPCSSDASVGGNGSAPRALRQQCGHAGYFS